MATVVDGRAGLTFGRRADLELDTNRYLHRVVGRFVERESLWWVQNLNGSTELHLASDARAVSVIGPRQQLPLTTRTARLSFRCGLAPYELELELDADPLDTAGDASAIVEGTHTLSYGLVPLTPSQHLLLVALAEPRLRAPAAMTPPLPSHEAVANRLGWSDAQVRRKLDNVCDKFRREGVRGLHNEDGGKRTERRAVLVEHVLATGLVSGADLGLLNDQ
jgi:hypothetical protein